MSVSYLDFNYANMISYKLERYKIVSHNPGRINFRCPLCGDSKKSKVKARGWLMQSTNGSFNFHCYNCGVSLPFGKFLKEIDITAYNNYITEKFIRNEKPKEKTQQKFEQPNFKTNELSKLKKITQLKGDHPAKQYIENRKIPKSKYSQLYYAPKFNQWINSILPDKLDKKMKEEPRLILPFKNKDGELFGVSARSFDPKSTLRYITILFNDSMPKLFGLNTVSFDETYFVCEGGLDSLFLSNAVAMAGADGNIKGLENIENAIFCYDNEPRNKEIHKRMEKIIKSGYKICIWPSNISQKDINEMILAGLKNIEKLIIDNTYSGLEAMIKLAAWRKV